MDDFLTERQSDEFIPDTYDSEAECEDWADYEALCD